MPQLHVYVAPEIADEIGKRAQRAGVSVSKFLADVVASALQPTWPAGYFEWVIGAWSGPAPQRPADAPAAVCLTFVDWEA